MIPVLGYWDVRAAAEPIRLLLHHAGIKFEDKAYKVNWDDFKKSEWYDVKYKLGLDFPNLPYYIDDDAKLTQSKAILRYLARKHGLSAQNEEEQWRLDMLEQEIIDAFSGVSAKEMMGENGPKYKREYAEAAPAKLKPLIDFLGQKKWILGGRLTYVDFMLYDTLFLYKILAPDLYNSHPNVLSYLERFENLKGVKEYMASPEYRRLPYWA